MITILLSRPIPNWFRIKVTTAYISMERWKACIRLGVSAVTQVPQFEGHLLSVQWLRPVVSDIQL
jgi:hypothetical protein